VIQVVMFWAGLWGELQKWMAVGFHMWIIILSLLAVSFRENMGTK
jgi:hypothetical protein